MVRDTYANYAELSRDEVRGIDFAIELRNLGSTVAVVALHGGRIELGTTEIARAIAGKDLTFYSFTGRKAAGNRALHLTSRHFDEPECLRLLERADTVLTVHGEHSKEAMVMIGGLDRHLREGITQALGHAGFLVVNAGASLSGEDPNNICNRGRTAVGVQLELTRGLRDKLLAEPGTLQQFAAAIRKAVPMR